MFQHALTNDAVVDYSDFVSHLKKDLHEAARILYNRKVRGSPLVVGDRVLIANRGVPGKRKVADKWESTPYEVMSVKPDINVYRVKDILTGRERVVHRNLLLSVNFLPCDRGEDLESVRSDSDAAIHGSVLCPDVPDVVEDSVERTVNWLMQTGNDGLHSEDNDSLDRASGVAQSDPLTVVTRSPTSCPVPVHNIACSTVDPRGDAQHYKDILPPDTDVAPSSFVCPDMSPLHDTLTDLALPVDNPLDVDVPVRDVLDSDCSDASIPGSLPQVVSIQPKCRVLSDRGFIKPPRLLVCEMNDHAVDEASVSTVSVSSLIQFFSSTF
ncbi:uncharacterized protein LOC124860071 [Girardinichthys multiradiatus]|uniref:uncharacterized protein LOC124860071 n=1 Tax=Girardinichthys multiradiatus TaxID=208333 RepID=UPI001FAE1C84|nr:uncharacterized protein LOC124860071 [Girardinichthys multiradiatus]